MPKLVIENPNTESVIFLPDPLGDVTEGDPSSLFNRLTNTTSWLNDQLSRRKTVNIRDEVDLGKADKLFQNASNILGVIEDITQAGIKTSGINPDDLSTDERWLENRVANYQTSFRLAFGKACLKALRNLWNNDVLPPDYQPEGPHPTGQNLVTGISLLSTVVPVLTGLAPDENQKPIQPQADLAQEFSYLQGHPIRPVIDGLALAAQAAGIDVNQIWNEISSINPQIHQNPDRQDPRQEGERGDFSFRASIISGGNIRTEAGLNKDVIDSLSNYTTNGILVTGIDTEGDAFGNSTEWYQVVLSDGRLAYVHSSLINVSVEQRQQLITEQAVFIADMLTNTESETPFSGQPPSDSTPLQEGSGNVYPWGNLVDAGEITSGGAEVLDQTAQTLKSSIESIVASQGKTAVTSVSWNGQLGDEFRIAVVAFSETPDTRTIYWPLTDSGNLSFSPTVWNQNGDHIELTFPKPIELSIGFNDGHENPYLIISHQGRPFAFLDTRTEHQKVLPLPGSEVPPELVQAILDGLEDPQVLDRFAPPLTEQQLAEQAEVLKMYPYGDEQALFQFAEQEGLSLLWNPELLAYEARENDKTYYFFPKMGMDGAKFTPRRYEADLRDGLTHFGGSLESQDYEKGVSGIKLNIFTSRNFEVDDVPMKLVFQEDLSNNQDKVDAFLRLLLEKILQPGRQINIILASDHLPVNGSSPEAIKSALELSGNYTFAVVSNDARTGSNLINEHTNLVRVSIDSSLSRYEDPDYLGEFVFVMVISHFLSNGRLDANDFNTTARGSREMLRLYEELGLHGFVLRAVPVTD